MARRLHFFVVFFFVLFCSLYRSPPFPQHTHTPIHSLQHLQFPANHIEFETCSISDTRSSFTSVLLFFFFKGKNKRQRTPKKTAARHSPAGRVWPRKIKQLSISFSRRGCRHRRRELEARKTRRKRKRKTENKRKKKKVVFVQLGDLPVRHLSWSVC